MDNAGTATHIYLNPIKAERADEWESFTRTAIMPAVQSQRPDLVERVRILRADDQQDGAALFVFVFEGGDIEDFNLTPLLVAEDGSWWQTDTPCRGWL